ISGLYHAALAPAAYASRIVLPPPLQGSLPAGWLAFTGRELNPLDRYKRFQITSLVPLFWICPGAREVSFEPPSRFTSLDHLVGAGEQHRRHGQTERIQGTCSISASCPHLARRLSGPALECMRECAHLSKAEQPRDLGYM